MGPIGLGSKPQERRLAHAREFSSDRAIREYCDEIWNVAPVRIALD
jgi:hypothetical protein